MIIIREIIAAQPKDKPIDEKINLIVLLLKSSPNKSRKNGEMNFPNNIELLIIDIAKAFEWLGTASDTFRNKIGFNMPNPNPIIKFEMSI